MTCAQQQPIGVFDSGIGGLSVLQALRAELPHERFALGGRQTFVLDCVHCGEEAREELCVCVWV